MVMIVLLKEAWICATPSVTTFFTFFRELLVAFTTCCVLPVITANKFPGLTAPELYIYKSLTLDWTPRPFTGSGIGPGTLPPQWQTTTMPDTTVTPKIHQPLDVHRDLTPQITLNGVFGDFGTQCIHLAFGQIHNPGILSNSSGRTNLACHSPTDPIYRGQRDYRMLAIWNINSCNTCHSGCS
jgi:hypothetical protein